MLDTTRYQRLCVPGYKKIEICRGVIFDEDAAFYKSKGNHFNEIHDEEPAAPRISET